MGGCKKHGVKTVNDNGNIRCANCNSVVSYVTGKKPVNTKGSVQGTKKDKYPTPKKGQRLKCTGCSGKGLVIARVEKPHNIWKTCQGCQGKGFIVA